MKTTSYLKTTILAMAIAGTSSAVFAATSDTLSISALVANVAAVKFGPALSFGIEPNGSGGSSLTGTTATTMCVYSSTGTANVVITTTNLGNLVGSASGQKIPYILTNSTRSKFKDLNASPTWTEQYANLNTASDCSSSTVATENANTLEFSIASTLSFIPKADTYVDTVNVAVTPV